jgi:hypothetical protein
MAIDDELSFESIIGETPQQREPDDLSFDALTAGDVTPDSFMEEDLSYDAMVGRPDAIGFGEAFTQDPLSKVPFIGGIRGTAEALDLMNSARNLTRDDYHTWEWEPGESWVRSRRSPPQVCSRSVWQDIGR